MKKPPTSEAALKRALKELKKGNKYLYLDHEYVWNDPQVGQASGTKDILLKIVSDESPDDDTQIVHWQSPLSEFYKKRQPLQPGVQKKIKKAIR